MLTAIEIDNFKRIDRRIRVELAPLTLIYGANDVGKSAILQSLIYFRHLLQRGMTDAEHTALGDRVDLDSFARLVHGHDLLRPVCIRIELGETRRIEIRVRYSDGSPPRASISELITCGHDATALILPTLGDATHIGSPRAVPSRHFPAGYDTCSIGWSDGLAAWAALLDDSNGLVSMMTAWLDRILAGRAGSMPQPSSGVSLPFLLSGDMGSGLTQLVPIVVAALERSRRGPILLEHPELNLHPALQVGLADLFIEASRERQLIVETHSEHLLLRMLRRIRETTEKALPQGAPAFTPDEVSVIHVEGGDEGIQVQRLRVDAHGDLLDPWPRGFFEERAQELF